VGRAALGVTGPTVELEIAPMHRIRHILCALSLLGLLLAGPAIAGIDNAGTTAANFLSVGTGAGILSMGGATLATGSDLNAAAWNPAALGLMNGSQLSLAHASLNASTSQEYLATGGRLGGNAMRWGANLLYQSEGAFDGTDATGASTGSFNVSNMAMGLSVARPFGDAVNVGLGMRYVNEKLGDASGSGLGFDFGVQAHSGQFGFGFAGRNVGGKMKYDSGSYDMPSVIGGGVSWSNPAMGLRVALDANLPKAYYNDVRIGGEYMWQERVALRAGYRMEMGAPAGEPLGGPTFGFGAGVAGLWMDYAFLSGQSEAQGQHRLGLTLRPGMMMHASSPMGANANSNDTHPIATPEHTAVATVVQAPAHKVEAPAPVIATVVPAPKVEAPAPMIATVVPAPKVEVPAPVAAPAPAAAAKPEAFAPVIATATLLAHNSDATDANAAPRASDASTQNLRASKPVRAPRLMAMAIEPAPKAAAAPRVAQPKVATVVEKSLRPAVVELAPAPMASAPAAPVAAAKPQSVPSSTQNANTHTDAPVVTIVPPAVLKPATPPPAEAPSAPSAPVQRPASVVVGRSDTLAGIAKQWGTSVAAIMMENNLVTDQVKPGAKLKLPPADKH
jgi:LysM repeat protein